MTDRELEERLRAWYDGEVPESEAAPVDLRERVIAVPVSSPMPLRPLARRRNFRLLAVAAVLVVGGGLAAGAGLVRLTAVVPPVSPVPSDAAELVTPAPTPATPQPTANLQRGDLVAYSSWGRTAPGRSRLWVSGADGRGAHEVFPGGVGDQYGSLAWSPDGSLLLYSEDGKLFLTDVNGSSPQRLDTGCVAPCSNDADASFSSDGTKIVFVRQALDADGQVESATIATLDLASGRVDLLASTATDEAFHPAWSPDGQRIVFSRFGEGDFTALFVVDQDGGNLHQISPPKLAARTAGWSPDGSRIVFTSVDDERAKTIYTIRPDGTDLRQLTSDGLSSEATWSADGRILFARVITDPNGPRGVSLWTMDADGTDAAVFVPVDATGIGEDEFPPVRAVPQPLGGPAIPAIAATTTTAITVGPPAPTPTPPVLGPGFSWTGQSTMKANSLLDETATLLADGRVLIAAGCSTTAEVYDPATGTFSPTGSQTRVRGSKTATRLNDGRVLLAGGYNCAPGGDGMWASAELYDPATGTFSLTGSMAAPRSQHTATLLADGRVLIAGGMSGPSATTGGIRLASYKPVDTDSFLATAEIYDPTTGTWSKTGSMSTPHRGHTSTLLEDGRVLVMGNGGESSPAGTAADVYDPKTGKWSRTGSMRYGRWLHTATLLPDGRVLILGGRTAKDSVRASAELYDPRSGEFSSAGSMGEGRQQHSATLLQDGRVFIAGGYWSDGQEGRVLASSELYDPGTGSFSPIGSIGDPRESHHAPLLSDGRVLLTGGIDIGRRGGVGLVTSVLYQP